MRSRRNRTRRLAAGLTVGLAHLLILWALTPVVSASLVEPESFPQTIDLWLGPAPGGSNRTVSRTSPGVTSETPRDTAKLPFETRKPPPIRHPEPLPPKAEAEKPPSPAAADPTAPATPSAAAGPANWTGRGLGRGSGRGMGRDLGGGGIGGSGENRGDGARKYVWARELTETERRAVYPQAGRYAAGGMVVLSCVLRGEDRLGGCLILAEQPAGHGFGAAAISASQMRGVRPMRPEDRPGPGERVNIEMRFIRLETGGQARPEARPVERAG